VAIVFFPIVITTITLLVIHRRTRRRGADLPLVAAIGTGVILGLATVEVAVVVAAVVTGGLTSALT
jgi:hypothetical protein